MKARRYTEEHIIAVLREAELQFSLLSFPTRPPSHHQRLIP